MAWISVNLVLWTSKRACFVLDESTDSRLFGVRFLLSLIEQVVIP